MKMFPATGWLIVSVVTFAAVTEAARAEDLQPPGGAHVAAAEEGKSPPEGETLSLADAIAAALRYSPELASDRAEVGAVAARAAQAGLWPNPVLDVMLENVGGSGDYEGVESSETTVMLAQPIELGGQRAERRRVVASGRLRLDRQMQAHRLAIIAEVRKRFLRVLLGQERRELTAEIEGLSAEALRAVEGRVKAGAGAPAERGQVRILLTRSRMDVQLAEREIVAARRQLAAMWGASEPSFAAAGDFEDVAPPPPLDELLLRLEDSPELAGWDAEVERSAAAVRLERANRIPAVTLAAGARHFNDNGDFAAVFDVSVPLPLFDRNQGGVLEAEYLLEKARAERDAALLRARTELLTAYDELQLQFERISHLGVHVLAEAKTASAETLESYRRGSAQAIDVLAAQRVLLEVRDEYFQALANYQSALVDVERLTTVAADAEAAR